MRKREREKERERVEKRNKRIDRYRWIEIEKEIDM